MSETLWAVIIGGLIAAIGGAVATIPSLFFNERRWKKEKKLEYLITERNRRKEQYKYFASKFPEAIEKNLSDDEILAEFYIDIPEKIQKIIHSWVKEIPNFRQESKKVDTTDLIFQMTESMKESLDEIDKEIKELMS